MRCVSFATRVCAVALCLAGFGTAANAHATIATFDPPGSEGTYPVSVNDSGSVAGWYSDGSTDHGFLRTSDGTITTFDGHRNAITTLVSSMNAGGAIVGYYEVSYPNASGYLRAADGTITTFDICSGDTLPTGINDKGTITGQCLTDGFVRETDGTVDTFSVSGASGTEPIAINDKGAITGLYFNANTSDYHGFVRTADGTITTFDPSGSKSSVATSINSKGAIVGYYKDANKVYHGFLRQPDGSITSIDVPGAAWTEVGAIDDKGRITGDYYIAATQAVNGFVISAGGKITTFVVPGRKAHTYPIAIARTSGIITGNYFEGSFRNEIWHGFVRTP